MHVLRACKHGLRMPALLPQSLTFPHEMRHCWAQKREREVAGGGPRPTSLATQTEHCSSSGKRQCLGVGVFPQRRPVPALAPSSRAAKPLQPQRQGAGLAHQTWLLCALPVFSPSSTPHSPLKYESLLPPALTCRSKVYRVAARQDVKNISTGEPTPQRLALVSSGSKQPVSSSSGFLAGRQCPACYNLFWMTTGHISCGESCAHLQLASACLFFFSHL